MPQSFDFNTAPKPVPRSGPGIFTYICVGVLLIGAMAGLQIRNQLTAKQRAEKAAPVEFSKADVDLSAPRKSVERPANVRGTASGALGLVREEAPAGGRGAGGSMRYVAEGRASPSKRQGRMGYLRGDNDVMGLAPNKGEQAFLGSETSDFFREMVLAESSPPLTFSGTGGPERFTAQIIRSRQAWDMLWRSVGGHDMPQPDFKREMGVAVFAGVQQAGSGIQIRSAKPKGGKFIVEYDILLPVKRQPGRNIRPYQVIVVPATRLPVVFRKAK
ncbi:MAG: hypothetical protein ABIJ96_04400 [Elusimicrobiota bacterium]